jgi:hypothetical protein
MLQTSTAMFSVALFLLAQLSVHVKEKMYQEYIQERSAASQAARIHGIAAAVMFAFWMPQVHACSPMVQPAFLIAVDKQDNPHAGIVPIRRASSGGICASTTSPRHINTSAIKYIRKDTRIIIICHILQRRLA